MLVEVFDLTLEQLGFASATATAAAPKIRHDVVLFGELENIALGPFCFDAGFGELDFN